MNNSYAPYIIMVLMYYNIFFLFSLGVGREGGVGWVSVYVFVECMFVQYVLSCLKT